MATDLILCGAIVTTNDEQKIEQTIKSIEKHNFNKKYLLFDGPPQSQLKKVINDIQNIKIILKNIILILR